MVSQTEFDELKKTIGQIKDRQDILDCIQRESRARDRQDVDQINGCWWPEGVDEHGPSTSKADVYAARANAGHQMFFNMTSHNITNHICDLQGDDAFCESYVVGGLFWKEGGKTSIAFGRYLDHMQKRNGEWRMLTRRCTIEMTADADATWINSEAIKGFLKPIWGKDDPSYDKPYIAKPRSEGVRW